ncbi:class I SAM-dependent rRNA methyltransferase [candidate division WOR-3 bacterium]|nr:class I SAM-dependent rRNA methyltransferase [candidate division WOR-3 bacterium]
MEKVYIRKHRPQHPWIFSNELTEVRKDIAPGSAIEVYKGKRSIGSGFYNAHSLIAIRKYARSAVGFDRAFVNNVVARAIEYRTKHIKHNSFRAVFSESDGLPGLIVDRYADGFVVQVHSFGIERHKQHVLDVLIEQRPRFIFEKSDAYLQKLEGLHNEHAFLYGGLDALVIIQQDDLQFAVDILQGQKTGFFFDLRDARSYVRSISKGKSVLDLFCYTGSFSIYAARGGARSVRGIDSSEGAVRLAEKNARLNQCVQISFERADVFEFLSVHKNTYDIIILDPPSFTRSRKKLQDARRGYLDINMRSMQRLAPGGILVTTCCSYHVSEEIFVTILQRAAHDAGQDMRVIGRVGQSADHPVLLGMPESRYLKCYILQCV